MTTSAYVSIVGYASADRYVVADRIADRAQRSAGRSTNRVVVLLMIAIFVSSWWAAVAPARGAPTSAPDLTGYTPVAPDPFVIPDDVGNLTAYFRTPNGLQCAMGFTRAMGSAAGCDGPMPTRPAEVNQITLGVSGSSLGATSKPSFVTPSRTPAPILRDGEKLSFAGFECAVGPGPVTSCTVGDPVHGWLVVSPSYTGVGPATEGLPAGFPDLNDFIADDDGHDVGPGTLKAKDLPASKTGQRIFAAGNGLACAVGQFFPEWICYGPLAGVAHGENKVSLGVSSGVLGATLGHTSASLVDQLAEPNRIRPLAVGHKFSGCMSLPDGVACYSPSFQYANTVLHEDQGFHGFKVTSSSTATY